MRKLVCRDEDNVRLLVAVSEVTEAKALDKAALALAQAMAGLGTSIVHALAQVAV